MFILQGTFLVTQAVTAALQEHKITSGSIVNFSSIVGKTGNMGQCNYAASKAGVLAFTKTAAIELSRYGLVLILVCMKCSNYLAF